MSNMVKYRAVSFKKDQIAALYFTMSAIVHSLYKFMMWILVEDVNHVFFTDEICQNTQD